MVVLSFDLASHKYAAAARRTISDLFPGRLTVIDGDSTSTLPEYHQNHPNLKCDLIVVDGGHAYDIALADLLNFEPMASEKNLVLIDDAGCESDYCVNPKKAWDEAKKRGLINEMACYPNSDRLRGFCVGQYVV